MSRRRDREIYAAFWWPPLERIVWAYRAAPPRIFGPAFTSTVLLLWSAR